MATPHEMMERLEHALAAPRQRGGVCLTLSVPRLLGEQGRFVGEDQYGPLYGYKRRQVKRMRNQIADALRENARQVVSAAVEHPESDFYTGDEG